MRKIFAVCKWELRKVFTDWKRTLAVFLLPAVLMLAALVLFPMLVNYLSTGSFGGTNIYVVNAPESFLTYYEEIDGRTAFNYIWEDSEASFDGSDGITVEFSDDFDSDVRDYFSELYESHDESLNSSAEITFTYENSYALSSKVSQFSEKVLDDYTSEISDILGIDTGDIEGELIKVDTFNPVGKILYNRTVANKSAARIIPSVMMLLLYYCVYSLSMDSFQGDRERGFFTKLKMTPVSIKTIIWGKVISIVLISTVSGLVTFVMMFIVSWTNISNDSSSLVPFGMFLLPGQLLLMLLNLVSVSFFMTAFAAYIVFSLEKREDVTINLQLPLVLLLAELFLVFLMDAGSLITDYLLPIHGTACCLRDIFRSDESAVKEIIVISVNALGTLLLMRRLFKKEALK